MKSVLGSAFDPDRRTVDDELLQTYWERLNLKVLPEGFDWARIGEEYIRNVKRILRSSEELLNLLTLHNQEAMRQGIDELVGIPPDFDLRKYQETLREQYGNLNLESLDTTGVYYNELKLWKMFVPQNVRECREFSPQIYEYPKEFFRRSQDGKKGNEVENPKVKSERHWQIYSEQTVRSVLDVLGNPYAGGDAPNYQTKQYIVILSDPGAGKSSLLRYIASNWTELASPQLSRHPIPLMVELRVYNRDKQNGRCQDVLSFSLAAIGDSEADLAKFDLPDRQIPIRIQIDPARRNDLNTLKNLQIPNQNGRMVPLTAVATIRFGSGPAEIERFN